MKCAFIIKEVRTYVPACPVLRTYVPIYTYTICDFVLFFSVLLYFCLLMNKAKQCSVSTIRHINTRILSDKTIWLLYTYSILMTTSRKFNSYHFIFIFYSIFYALLLSFIFHQNVYTFLRIQFLCYMYAVTTHSTSPFINLPSIFYHFQAF